MANYYLKNKTGEITKMYRLEYTAISDPLEVRVKSASITGVNAVLPDQTIVNGIDEPVDVSQVLIDLVLTSVVEGTVAEYGTLVASLVTSQWG
jgi:hypothetical protein